VRLSVAVWPEKRDFVTHLTVAYTADQAFSGSLPAKQLTFELYGSAVQTLCRHECEVSP
jgi:hypothetical protein